VLWETADPSGPLSDTAQHLSMAEQFSRLESYRINGALSAYHAPGYPFLLTPVAWLSRTTGWFSLSFGAALVNVVAGTVTIVLAALLAQAWIGRRATTPAAWLLAVAPAPIYLTSIALNETVHTTVVLAALLVVTALLQGRLTPRPAVLAGLGALVGYAVLVRATGAVLVVVAVIALRVVTRSWRSTLRPALVVLGIAAVMVLPWVVRNGVQVGVWSPSGNAAAFLCHGHGPRAQAEEVDLSDDDISRCFVGTAYGPDPDEATWYRERVSDALSWAVGHPGEELSLTVRKTVALYLDDSQSLADAADFNTRHLASPATTRRLDWLADAWQRLVVVLALAGLVLSRDARRAWPLWGTVVGLTMAVWAGSVLDRYHHTIMAIAVTFASATLVTVGRWASAGVGIVGDVGHRDPAEDGPPPSPEEGLAAASTFHSRWTGPQGHPFQPILAAVALGAWVGALVFDGISLVSSTEWVYARGAWLMTGLGVAAALGAAFAALADLLAVPAGTVARQVGVRHLIAVDVAIVAQTASFLVRNGSDFPFHEPSPTAAIVLSVVGLAAMGVSQWLAGTLTYRYGLRVLPDAERLEGFRPVSAADEVEQGAARAGTEPAVAATEDLPEHG
jgi:uncharacterized membrane protein